jgi:diguanylate cyclase (GGDEF)-like protein
MPASILAVVSARIGLRVAFGTLLAILSVIYLAAPDTWGGIVFFATVICGLVSLSVGPFVHRPVNRGPWRCLTSAGALFLVGLLIRMEVVTLPGLTGNADLWAFGGYACTLAFLAGLLRRTQSGPDLTLWLDTAAITTGSALIGWVMNVAPELTRPDPHLGPLVVNAIYPVMDAMLLALTVQLGFRRGSQVPALQAAMTGLAAMLIGDLAYTFIWAAEPGAVNPYVNVAYLVAYACLGLMAMHPSMRQLSDVDARHNPVTSRSRLVLILLAMLTPASIPVMLPTHTVLDGSVRAVIMSVFGGLVFLRLLGTINALQRAEAKAHYRATHDPLTDLPNRGMLLEYLETHLNTVKSSRRTGWVNVFFVDCDHFKQINDSWGHTAGDEILIELAGRLRSMLRVGDYLGRVGGDEFVLLVDTEHPSQAAAIAERINAMFHQPLKISNERITQLTLSIGIAQASYYTTVTAEDMVHDADLALYEAKNAGRSSFATYDTSMHDRVQRRHSLSDALIGALDRDEIQVVFQPIRGGAGYGELTGWEALVRWQHPHLGSVSPVEFIPIAEDTGLIVDIGAFVLRRASGQLKLWQTRFNRPDLHMSVNVSSVQLLRDDMVALVSEVLTETDLVPESLWLEVTESVLLERTEDALGTLNALAEVGVKLCMDDFGTGYSSLSYLKDFTVHILKVDRAFVRDLVDDQRDRELTKAVIDVATALGLDGVVAEGVETEAQAAVLAELGCSFAQGFLYGRPAPPEQAEAEVEALLGLQPAAPAGLPQQRQADPTPVPTPIV